MEIFLFYFHECWSLHCNMNCLVQRYIAVYFTLEKNLPHKFIPFMKLVCLEGY